MTSVSIGKYSYAAVDENKVVWVWGENKNGQLGLNDYTDRQTPYPITSLKEKVISEVCFGRDFAVAVAYYPQ